MPRPCLYCKSITHADTSCPVYLRSTTLSQMKSLLSRPDFSGVSPSPFIGRFGYPHVFVGALATPIQENKELLDAPKKWVSSGLKIGEIASLRAGLVNARAVVDVHRVERVLPVIQEVAVALQPVEVDVQLKHLPVFCFRVDTQHAPMGPSVELQKLSLSSNPHIPTKVDKVVSDTDLAASAGLQILYEKGIDEYGLAKILSVGALGVSMQRRLVPTRWAITATDDILGKSVILRIRSLSIISESLVLCNEYLGNYYVILVLPHLWQFELFEIMTNSPHQFSTDYEGFSGRKNYAEQCAGGYYSVRLAVSEWLSSQKRQASVLVFRFITPAYDMPLGVWVTREAARQAVTTRPVRFSSQELAVLFISRFAAAKFGIDVSKFFKQSCLLAAQKQKKLDEFI